MKYKVNAHYFDDQEVVDEVIVDTLEEAVDLRDNWQAYYDDCQQWDDKEVIVAIYEVYEEGDKVNG